jgi:hypothetical protein
VNVQRPQDALTVAPMRLDRREGPRQLAEAVGAAVDGRDEFAGLAAAAGADRRVASAFQPGSCGIGRPRRAARRSIVPAGIVVSISIPKVISFAFIPAGPPGLRLPRDRRRGGAGAERLADEARGQRDRLDQHGDDAAVGPQADGRRPAKAVIFMIDSPGGTVAGAYELASDIAALAKQKPVHAHAANLVASAAY